MHKNTRSTALALLMLLVAILSPAAVQASSSVYAWGGNHDGQVGNGTTTNSNVPSQITGLTDAIAISQGQAALHCLAIKSDGTVWAWGRNLHGELGDGTTANSSVPVMVSGLSGAFTAVTAGYGHSLALKSDGTVWAWGTNTSGVLGTGSTANESFVPAPVFGLTGVTAIAAGSFASMAVKSDGTVWAWGFNYSGQLGDGTTIDRYVPVEVAGLTGMIAVSVGNGSSLALKSDGTVWAWGANNFGELGNGTSSSSPNFVPTMVAGISGQVVAIAAGNSHCLVLKADGTVWAWGNNGNGQLGNKIGGESDLPVYVSGLSGVTAIAAGSAHSFALKSDGTVWAWGNNFDGELGNSKTAGSNVPVQVTGLTGAMAIGGGYYHGIAEVLPPISPPPSSLSATAGDRQVNLSWMASPGATSYNVNRSTVGGGPYTAIASPTAISYANTGLINGTVYYYVVTAATSTGESGNSNEASATPKAPDTSRPSTTVSYTGAAGNNEWYVAPVQVTLTATDPDGPSDVASVHYSIDSGTDQIYNGPFTISGDGAHMLIYFSVDFAGNVEYQNVRLVNIDGTPPVLTITAPSNGSSYVRGQTVLANYASSDGSSGVISITGIGSSIDTAVTGPHTVTVTATDNAGNTTSLSVTYSVVAQIVTTISITPTSAIVRVRDNQLFGALAFDQIGNPMPSSVFSPSPVFTWSISGGGAINSTSGVFTAGSMAGGPFTVTATTGSVAGTSIVQVVTSPVIDFNGDGKPDLILQNSGSRQIAIWYLYRASIIGGQYTPVVPGPAWATVGAGDFNGDGWPDLVLQNTSTYQIAIWTMNGSNVLGGKYISGTAPTGWNVVAVRDFTNDGKPDLVLQNTATYQIALWTMNGTSVVHGQYLNPTPAPGWIVAGSGDFNGDGTADLVLQNESTRAVTFWYFNGFSAVGAANLSAVPPLGWSVMATGDYNDDGRTDLVLQNTVTRQVAFWYLNGTTVASGAYVLSTPSGGWKVVGPQ